MTNCVIDMTFVFKYEIFQIFQSFGKGGIGLPCGLKGETCRSSCHQNETATSSYCKNGATCCAFYGIFFINIRLYN